MLNTYKILILEDDSVLLETLADELSNEHTQVDSAKHGEEVLDLTSKNHYDLYIFDINVPYIDGLTLLNELRAAGDETPAIFLTSKNEEPDRIKGFEAGCDDYLAKPFSLSELKLRVKAVLKRAAKKLDVIYDDVSIDLKTNILRIKDKTVEIDKKDLEILHLFISNQKSVFSIDDIISHLYRDKLPSATVLRVHISKINALFEKKRIVNIRGLGYKYEKK